MMNQEKKVVYMSGSVQNPLKVGLRAVIFHTKGRTWTSPVAAIHQIADDLIVFETRNSTYCVAPRQSPTPAMTYADTALCA